MAAEQQLTEDEAWTRAEQASRVRARELGRDGWRTTYWQPALADAELDRPRRYRIDDHDIEQQVAAEERTEVAAVRAALRSVVTPLMDAAKTRSSRRRSIQAALDALAPALVSRDGSLDTRTWSERARLARSTLFEVRDWLIANEVIEISHRYGAGTADCHAYQPGPVAAVAVEETRTTRCTPPQGLPPTASQTPRASAEPTGRTGPPGTCSVNFQQSLKSQGSVTRTASTQQPEPCAVCTPSVAAGRPFPPPSRRSRREARRALLRTLSASDRDAWFEWLARRELLRIAAAQVYTGTALTADHQALATAPLTVHRGMLDPLWRDGGSPTVPAAEQLALAA